MKQLGFVLIAIVAGLCAARAQVTVEVMMEQDQFLPAEAIPVAVRVVNRSGQTLYLGADNNWLSFTVESRDNRATVITRVGDPVVEGAFELANSKMATKRVDIGPCFLLGNSGRYAVSATIRIPGWDREISSPPKTFMIVTGTPLWERAFGVPDSATEGGAPEVRKYVLQQANYLRSQIRLYLRLTDGTGLKTLRVFPIGRMVSFSRPEPQVDKASNLHVLYQDGPHSFSYTIYNPEARLITRQTYDYTTRPRLRVDDDGEVAVVGGTRRVASNDFPPPPPPEDSSTNAVESPNL